MSKHPFEDGNANADPEPLKSDQQKWSAKEVWIKSIQQLERVLKNPLKAKDATAAISSIVATEKMLAVIQNGGHAADVELRMWQIQLEECRKAMQALDIIDTSLIRAMIAEMRGNATRFLFHVAQAHASLSALKEKYAPSPAIRESEEILQRLRDGIDPHRCETVFKESAAALGTLLSEKNDVTSDVVREKAGEVVRMYQLWKNVALPNKRPKEYSQTIFFLSRYLLFREIATTMQTIPIRVALTHLHKLRQEFAPYSAHAANEPKVFPLLFRNTYQEIVKLMEEIHNTGNDEEPDDDAIAADRSPPIE